MLQLGILILQLILLSLLASATFKGLGRLFFRILRSKKITVFTIGIIFIFGTLVHELSHLLMAKLLFVPTGKLTLWPEIEEDGVKMGSLQIAKVDQVRRTIVGIAPILFGTMLILGGLYFTNLRGLTSRVEILLLLGFLTFTIGNTMFSSKKDLEGAWLLLLVIVAIVVALLLLGVRVNPGFILTPTVTEVIERANELLLVPILIDLVLVVFLKII